MTRHQIERSKERSVSSFRMTNALAHTMKPDAIIMHPLPRKQELPEEVDDNPRSVYFTEQIQNGLWTRMSLLHYLMGNVDMTTG